MEQPLFSRAGPPAESSGEAEALLLLLLLLLLLGCHTHTHMLGSISHCRCDACAHM
jgi:hypothetical protein